MKRTVTIILFAFSITLINAQKSEVLTSIEKYNLKSIESIYDEQGRKVDKETEKLRINRNEYFKLEGETDAEVIAIAFLQEKGDQYGLSCNLNDVKIEKIADSPAGNYVYFRQYINDIPVFATNFTIFINKENIVTYASSEFRNLDRYNNIQTTPVVNSDEALQIASKYLNIDNNIWGNSEIELVYFESTDIGLELAWKINIVPMKSKEDWQIFISADSSHIIHAKDLRVFVDGSGKTFNPNPLVSANVSYGHNNCFLHNNGAANSCLDGQIVQVTLKDLDSAVNGIYSLIGLYCCIQDVDEPYGNIIPESTTPNFHFTRDQQDQFTAVMCYYHVDLSARRLVQLGYNFPNNLYYLNVDPYGVEGERNAYYHDRYHYLTFGGGGNFVRAAEDADVIWHEHAHAIQYNFGKGNMINGGETQALLEGSSDYWATSYKRSLYPNDWAEYCKWFAMNDPNFLRRTDRDWVYPKNYYGGHEGGQIWSSALMKIWGDLGRDITDQLYLETHFLWSQNSKLRDAASAFMQADMNLYNGIHLCHIKKRFIEHGLIDLSIIHETITQNTTWSTPKNQKKTVAIKNGVTLTITSTIECDNDVSIIIQPGGKLILDGGTLTNACSGEMWQGITVLGDKTKPISSGDQTLIQIRGGIIENAVCGVRVYDGGRVTASSSSVFRNNTISVKFEPKAAGQSGTSGSFTRTNFILNSNYLGNLANFEAHIMAQGSGNVEVRGCHFSSIATQNTGVNNKNNGIVVFNTNLMAQEYCTGALNVHTGFCESGIVSNYFTGFTNAILASNSGASPTLQVRNSIFNSNPKGIANDGINYPKLIWNEFLVNISSDPFNHYNFGVYINNATGYKIEENNFSAVRSKGANLNLNNRSIGLFINNSGTNENEVYKNTFRNLAIGQNFFGINASQVLIAHPTGLQTLCNSFGGEQNYDIFVGPLVLPATQPHIIRAFQGSLQKSAGNLFNGTPFFKNIDNSVAPYPITYYYINQTNENPPVTANVSKIPVFTSNGCPSKIIVYRDSNDPLSQYDEWNDLYEYWLAQLATMNEDDEDYELILDKVSYYSALKDNYFNSIIVAAITDEVIRGLDDEVIIDGVVEQGSLYENLRFLFNYRNHYVDNLSIVETYLAENNYRDAIATLFSMYEKFELTEEQMSELAGLQTYIYWLQQLENDERTIYILSEREIEYLESFVETHIGRGRVFANNILCVLYGICMEDEMMRGLDDEMMRKLDDEMIRRLDDEMMKKSPSNIEGVDDEVGRGSLFEKITVTPNPTTGELRIDNGQLTIDNVEVFDVYGRKLSSHHLITSSSHHLINISHLPAGLYFVKITTEAGMVVKKVVKQ